MNVNNKVLLIYLAIILAATLSFQTPLTSDIGTKFLFTLLVVLIGVGFVFRYFTYKESDPNHALYKWQGGLLFFAVLSFIVYAFADMYCEVGLIDNTLRARGGMQTCLYFSILTLVGASYGDVIPSELARFFVVIQTVLGYFSFAFIVAIMLDALRSGAHSN